MNELPLDFVIHADSEFEIGKYRVRCWELLSRSLGTELEIEDRVEDFLARAVATRRSGGRTEPAVRTVLRKRKLQ